MYSINVSKGTKKNIEKTYQNANFRNFKLTSGADL